jgi:hypothetical protein
MNKTITIALMKISNPLFNKRVFLSKKEKNTYRNKTFFALNKTKKSILVSVLVMLFLLTLVTQLNLGEASTYFNLSYGGVSSNLAEQKPAMLDGKRYIFTTAGFSGNDYVGFNQTIQVYAANDQWQPTSLLATTSTINYGLFFVYTAPTSSLNDLIIICGSMAGLTNHNAFIGAFNTTSNTFQNFTQIDGSFTYYVTQVTYVQSMNEFVLTFAQGAWSNNLVISTPDNLFTPSNWQLLGTLDFSSLGEHSFSYFSKTGYGYALQWNEYGNDVLVQINMTTGENTIIWNSTASLNIVRQYISSDNNYLYFSSSDVNDKFHYWKYDGTTFADMYATPIVGAGLVGYGNQHHANIMATYSPDTVLISNINTEFPDSYYALLNTTSDSIVETYQGNIQAEFGDNTPTFDGLNFILGSEAIGSGAPTFIYILTNLTPLPANLPNPSITVSCQTYTSESNFKVEIRGNLTMNETGLTNVPILLSYSVDDGKAWNELTTVATNDNGSFFAVWFPNVSGSYLLKAEWAGDANYSDASTVVNFAVTPSGEQTVFSVTSNSTISSLAFNSTSEELYFTVSGPSGTTGYTDVYVPKSMITNVSSLKIFLDGNLTSYNVEPNGDSWLVTFTYHHSVHNVIINLKSQASTKLDIMQLLQGVAFGVIISIIVITLIFLILRKNRTKKITKPS